MSHQFGNLCYHIEKFVIWGGGMSDGGEYMGGNVWGKMSGEKDLGERMSGSQKLIFIY